MVKQKNRIVITGIGVVSPIGMGKEKYWSSLFEGKNGFKPITLFDTASFNVNRAGEITEFNPQEILGKKGLIDLDRATTLLLSSMKYALEDGHLEINETNTYRTGISVGTTFGSLSSLTEFDQASIIEGPHFVNPSRFPNTVINAPASRAAIRFGVKGLNATISTGICAGLDALQYAVHSISAERADRIIVGAVEEMCFPMFFGFHQLGYLSGLQNGNEPVSCPFDNRRDGIVFSEGAAVVIIENLDFALSRNAPIYGEITAIESNFYPYRLHKYNQNGIGMIGAMEGVLKKAKIKSKTVDCIFANANSTYDGDLAEANAIKKVFGKSCETMPISAIKAVLGETFSASGEMALIGALGAIKNDIIPAVVHYEERGSMFDLDYVSYKTLECKVQTVLVNAFSPNGGNVSLVVKRYEG